MIDVAVIGAGAISSFHLDGYLAFPERCRVVAVADLYRDTPDSAITSELDGAERNLLTARRAVERAQRNLP